MQDLRKVHVVYPILTDVIELALRLSGTKLTDIYTDGGQVEFARYTRPNYKKLVFAK